MEDIKKEFECQAIKSLASPRTAIDELWQWIESKIKDAKEEGFQAGCDFTCKQYKEGE